MRLTLLAALPLALLACSSKGPVRDPAELTKIESPEFKPRVVWDEAPGDGDDGLHARLGLAVEPDVLVTADVDGEVFALNPKDGHRLWKAKTQARIISGPTVSGAIVLVGTLDAQVIALKRSDGTEAWRADVSSEVLAAPAGDGPIIVVRCGDGKVFGLSAETGVRKWSFERTVPPLTLRGMSAPLVNGNDVYIGLDNGHLAALRLDTGEVLWEQVVSAPSGRSELERIVDVDADPILAADGAYAVSFGGDLAAVGLADGRVAWRRPIKSYSGVALLGNVLVATDEDGLVWALDAQTGAASWKQEALKYRKLSPPIAVGDYIVVADYEGYLHWLSPQDGKIVARVRAVRKQVSASMVEKDGLLYVLDRGGRVAAVESPAVN